MTYRNSWPVVVFASVLAVCLTAILCAWLVRPANYETAAASPTYQLHIVTTTENSAGSFFYCFDPRTGVLKNIKPEIVQTGK